MMSGMSTLPWQVNEKMELMVQIRTSGNPSVFYP